MSNNGPRRREANRYRLSSIACCLAIMPLLISASSQGALSAAEPNGTKSIAAAGRIIFATAHADVTVQRGGEELPGKIGMDLRPNDRVTLKNPSGENIKILLAGNFERVLPFKGDNEFFVPGTPPAQSKIDYLDKLLRDFWDILPKQRPPTPVQTISQAIQLTPYLEAYARAERYGQSEQPTRTHTYWTYGHSEPPAETHTYRSYVPDKTVDRGISSPAGTPAPATPHRTGVEPSLFVSQNRRTLTIGWSSGVGPFVVTLVGPSGPVLTNQILTRKAPLHFDFVIPALQEGSYEIRIEDSSKPHPNFTRLSFRPVLASMLPKAPWAAAPDDVATLEERVAYAAWLGVCGGGEWRLEAVSRLAELSASNLFAEDVMEALLRGVRADPTTACDIASRL
jgi:hypothetical protein